MDTSNVVSRIKGIFRDKLLKEDGRCKIQALEFISALVCSFATQNGRVKSLSAMRKSVIAFTGQKISRGSFWERMAAKKLKGELQQLLFGLINGVCVQAGIGLEIVQLLAVKKILLLDASSFSLPEGAKVEFPAPRNNVNPSAVKTHVLLDLFGQAVRWFEITPATTHDRKGFPPLSILKGALIVFDLGYWDFQLLKDMISEGIFFLSRVKSNAKIEITNVIKGVSSTCIGFDLHSGRLSSFRGEIIEVMGRFIIAKTKEEFCARVIGFWSTQDSMYHWYVTNLTISSDVIYPLYRLRWQLELIWKSWKSFFQLDEITSTNSNIIFSTLLAGMCAGIISGVISVSALNGETAIKQAANSVQRAVSLMVRTGELLFQFIQGVISGAKKRLLERIELFKDDLFDPNYKNRINSVRRVYIKMCPG